MEVLLGRGDAHAWLHLWPVVSFQWKNAGLLLKNAGLLLKNADFVIKQADLSHALSPGCGKNEDFAIENEDSST